MDILDSRACPSAAGLYARRRNLATPYGHKTSIVTVME